MLGNVAISWRAKKQSATSRNTAKAEYRVLAYASCEVMWLKGLLTDLGVNIDTAVSLHCDNKAAIDLLQILCIMLELNT